MLKDKILKLLFVPKCVCCNDVLPYDSEFPLCEECLARWEEEKNEKCPECGEKQKNCICRYIREVMDDSIHLTRYSSGEDSVTRSIVYALKGKNNGKLFEFLAKELAENCREKYDLSKTYVCYVPRNPKKVGEKGYDQAKIIAKKLADELGLPFCELFSHKYSRTEQKKLDHIERNEHAEMILSYNSKDEAFPKYKNFLLVDDMITTAASINACASLLKLRGARKVHAVVVAKNQRKTEKKKEKTLDMAKV